MMHSMKPPFSAHDRNRMSGSRNSVFFRARLVAGRKIFHKYRRVYIQKLQQKEYDKLQRMVPNLQTPSVGDKNQSNRKKKHQKVSKIKVIEETIRYIDQLHQALADRVRNESNGQLCFDQEAAAASARETFIANSYKYSTGSCPGESVVCEKDRCFPTYMIQSDVLSRMADRDRNQ